MAPPSWAYQTEYFDPPPNQELICDICHLVFCEPMEGPCRHVFCSKCIKPWIGKHHTCPLCCVQMTDNLLRPTSRIIETMINGSAMRCKNSERGCQMQLTHDATEGHTLLCQFESEECSNGCGKSLLRKDMTEHEAKDCPRRRSECLECGLTVLGSMTGHNCIRVLRQEQKTSNEEHAELKSKVEKLQKELDAFKKGTEFLVAYLPVLFWLLILLLIAEFVTYFHEGQ